MAKRRRVEEDPLSDTPHDIHILTADRQEPLLAHLQVLMLFSKLARGLPLSTDGSPTRWDLRGLVLEGESEPVAAAVVERWLDAMYAQVDKHRRLRLPSTLAEARPLLLLADALDTTAIVVEGMGWALAEQPDLALTVAVGELKVDLQLKGRLHFDNEGSLIALQQPTGKRSVLVAKEAFEPHAAAFPSAVARELESWLHLAGRLNLVPLARALMGFVKAELMPFGLSILRGSVSSVFSPRVLQFMPRELLLEGFVRDALLERPTQAAIKADEVEVTMSTPLLSAWYGNPLGSVIKANAKPIAEGRSTAIVGRVDLPLNATMGGPGRETCAQLVEEAGIAERAAHVLQPSPPGPLDQLQQFWRSVTQGARGGLHGAAGGGGGARAGGAGASGSAASASRGAGGGGTGAGPQGPTLSSAAVAAPGPAAPSSGAGSGEGRGGAGGGLGRRFRGLLTWMGQGDGEERSS
ncbi:hypothetical protein HYH03_017782 [Edaphochlamys debaryana]|uniref:Uncharacterized protein n=1 Tax=Edaphochlamys debaryana TaxID=47281 RepID=A0A835XNI0_9CHLO|nr:hypothetical protein HYH03_017782 [Edaphochlamys debaryana]|eukprot:KAG2483334.1 hypothetical protein HYH03_017782 [Edaphochlamys debaryana]